MKSPYLLYRLQNKLQAGLGLVLVVGEVRGCRGDGVSPKRAVQLHRTLLRFFDGLGLVVFLVRHAPSVVAAYQQATDVKLGIFQLLKKTF